MAKFHEIINLLEERIANGDYHLRRFPTDVELAVKTNVSHVTARKAISHLIERGLLERDRNGRVTIGSAAQSVLTVGLLMPTYLSPMSDPYIDLWRRGLVTAAERFGARVRVVLYSHWNDAVIDDAIEGFDGMFLVPIPMEIPQRLIKSLQQAGPRTVVLSRDLSAHGIQSVRMSQPSSVHLLLDHLASLGHRHIDCFNIQPTINVIRERMEQWRLWQAAQGMRGELLEVSGDSPGGPTLGQGLQFSYEWMGRLLDQGRKIGTAVFCTTAPAALGAMRAMTERGIQVGRDISLCAATDEGMAEYVTPSLTCLRACDPSPSLYLCLKRIATRGQGWIGPLLFQPEGMTLFEGQSTGPAPASAAPTEHMYAGPAGS